MTAFNRYLRELEAERLPAPDLIKSATVAELADIVGVKIAANMCPKCGAEMEKDGAIYKCGCGMMKGAQSDIVAGGKADKLKDKDFSKKQMEMGEKVELEHTDTPALAREISRDHLEEFPDYYTRLDKMEEKAKEDWKDKKKEGAKKDQTNWKAVAALPPAGAAGGAVLGAITGALQRGTLKGMKPGAIRGGLVGAGVGTAAAGLIGLGTLLEKADPSGKTLKTVVQLAPAAGTMAGMYTQTKKDWGEEKEAAIKPPFPRVQAAVGKAIGKHAPMKWPKQLGEGIARAGTPSPRAKKIMGAVTKAVIIGDRAVRAGKKLLKTSSTKEARDMPPFLEQDRPAKVKEIYSALKRDHPDMPAEMKARIAARQGKKGKQKQGPPYKGPIKSKYKASMVLDKLGQDFDRSELEESMGEAMEREDVPGRAKRWALGSGAAGTLGGAALGMGLGRISGRKWVPWVASPLLGMAGGAGGAFLGARHGAEEALADQAVSRIRALRAHQAGLQSGYESGVRTGAEAVLSRLQGEGGKYASAGAATKSLLTHPITLSTAAGAVAGAGLGYATADKENRAKATAIGAGTGAAMGALVGALGGVSPGEYNRAMAAKTQEMREYGALNFQKGLAEGMGTNAVGQAAKRVMNSLKKVVGK